MNPSRLWTCPANAVVDDSAVLRSSPSRMVLFFLWPPPRLKLRLAHAEQFEQRGPETLADLRKRTAWTWVYCERCLHHSPVAFVPLMIRWGADASSDKLRRCARCTLCGHKGATLQHPGWVDTVVGFQPFPAD